MAKQFQHREQPVKTGVTFDGDVQPARFAQAKGAKFFFHRVDFRQDTVCCTQHPDAGGRQAHGLGSADEQFHSGLIFQICHLM